MTNKQFTEEVFARSKKYAEKRRKRVTAVCTAAMLLIVCSVGLSVAVPDGNVQSGSNAANSQYSSAADVSGVNIEAADGIPQSDQNIGTVLESMTGISAADDGKDSLQESNGLPGNTDNCSEVSGRLEHFDGTNRIVTGVTDPVKAKQITDLFKEIADTGKDLASNGALNESEQTEYLWIYKDEQYEIIGNILIASTSQGKKIYEMTDTEAEEIKRQLTVTLCERSTDERKD